MTASDDLRSLKLTFHQADFSYFMWVFKMSLFRPDVLSYFFTLCQCSKGGFVTMPPPMMTIRKRIAYTRGREIVSFEYFGTRGVHK
jgi:hypothetical protein